jgi:hypothetical protein
METPMPPLIFSVQKVLDSLTAAMEGNGIIPGEVVLNGQLHRCATADKPHSLNAWYIAYGDDGSRLPCIPPAMPGVADVAIGELVPPVASSLVQDIIQVDDCQYREYD